MIGAAILACAKARSSIKAHCCLSIYAGILQIIEKNAKEKNAKEKKCNRKNE
jgi:hypothetical protein